MLTEENVKELVLNALEEVKASDEALETVEFSDNTIVLGIGAELDSIGATAFLTSLEDKIEEKSGVDYVFDYEKITTLNNGNSELSVSQISKFVSDLLKKP